MLSNVPNPPPKITVTRLIARLHQPDPEIKIYSLLRYRRICRALRSERTRNKFVYLLWKLLQADDTTDAVKSVIMAIAADMLDLVGGPTKVKCLLNLLSIGLRDSDVIIRRNACSAFKSLYYRAVRMDRAHVLIFVEYLEFLCQEPPADHRKLLGHYVQTAIPVILPCVYHGIQNLLRNSNFKHRDQILAKLSMCIGIIESLEKYKKAAVHRALAEHLPCLITGVHEPSPLYHGRPYNFVDLAERLLLQSPSEFVRAAMAYNFPFVVGKLMTTEVPLPVISPRTEDKYVMDAQENLFTRLVGPNLGKRPIYEALAKGFAKENMWRREIPPHSSIPEKVVHIFNLAFQDRKPRVRAAMTTALLQVPEVLSQMDPFLSMFYKLLSDSDGYVRTRACRKVGHFLDVVKHRQPHLLDHWLAQFQLVIRNFEYDSCSDVKLATAELVPRMARLSGRTIVKSHMLRDIVNILSEENPQTVLGILKNVGDLAQIIELEEFTSTLLGALAVIDLDDDWRVRRQGVQRLGVILSHLKDPRAEIKYYSLLEKHLKDSLRPIRVAAVKEIHLRFEKHVDLKSYEFINENLFSIFGALLNTPSYSVRITSAKLLGMVASSCPDDAPIYPTIFNFLEGFTHDRVENVVSIARSMIRKLAKKQPISQECLVVPDGFLSD